MCETELKEVVVGLEVRREVSFSDSHDCVIRCGTCACKYEIYVVSLYSSMIILQLIKDVEVS